MDDDPSATDASDAPDRCANCATSLDRGSWHPTVGWTDADDTYHLARFCSDACRDEWHRSRDGADTP
ncbi:hypothetical protein Htur_0130 [Haloterrigena turkmenica DSM 5511]|uniref:Uncharacterized protein n=1 Tax=Haloterrigena turkmenica (strain ATCC 51198 / DSM 5511 / JCM 9101 / NCIMB 13204 / VKM B-1734 / 4k) TaxID=543526 RepID=D2RTI8_HALTV|nr:hypothetical protein [Haloterrigena turkmenica]ADB59031.1 hypothetical protein Htur_0130 [Haloterrigena turkmenica DSM 5511]